MNKKIRNRAIYSFLALIFLLSCDFKSHRKTSDIFEKSFKEQNRNGLLINKTHLNKEKNIYSNYYYHIAFDGPDTWEVDDGTADDVIYRTYDRRYGISFSIAVMEFKDKKTKTSWDVYNSDRLEFRQKMKIEMENIMNTTLKDLVFDKTYIKNRVSTKISCNFIVKNLNHEYLYKSIAHQINVDNLMFTFGIQLPMEVYNSDRRFYEKLFDKITFLPHK